MSKYSMHDASPVGVVENTSKANTFVSVMVDDAALRWAGRRLFRQLSATNLGFDVERLNGIEDSVVDFYREFLSNHPDAHDSKPGSTSVQGLLPLWVMARLIAPDVLIESGVFVGGSLRMFRQAVPAARIIAYDISFAPLRFRHSSIEYRETDWVEVPPEIRADDEALVFFDDHISAVQRLSEARRLGVRWVIFDDNPAVGQVGRYRYPSLPSVPMIIDDQLPEGLELEWRHPAVKGVLRYVHDASSCVSVRGEIAGVVNIGALMADVGVSSGDKWLVKLKTETLPGEVR